MRGRSFPVPVWRKNFYIAIAAFSKDARQGERGISFALAQDNYKLGIELFPVVFGKQMKDFRHFFHFFRQQRPERILECIIIQFKANALGVLGRQKIHHVNIWPGNALVGVEIEVGARRIEKVFLVVVEDAHPAQAALKSHESP